MKAEEKREFWKKRTCKSGSRSAAKKRIILEREIIELESKKTGRTRLREKSENLEPKIPGTARKSSSKQKGLGGMTRRQLHLKKGVFQRRK